MQDEHTIFLIGLYPLVYLLTVPIILFYFLKTIRHVFGIFRDRKHFLQAYIILAFAVTGIVFSIYYEVVRAADLCR